MARQERKKSWNLRAKKTPDLADGTAAENRLFPSHLIVKLNELPVNGQAARIALCGASAARKGRNPQTGKEMKVAAKKVPKLTPGKGLKVAIK